MAFKTLSHTVKIAEWKCVFAFGVGAYGGEGAVQARLPPSGTSLACWIVETVGKAWW